MKKFFVSIVFFAIVAGGRAQAAASLVWESPKMDSAGHKMQFVAGSTVIGVFVYAGDGIDVWVTGSGVNQKISANPFSNSTGTLANGTQEWTNAPAGTYKFRLVAADGTTKESDSFDVVAANTTPPATSPAPMVTDLSGVPAYVTAGKQVQIPVRYVNATSITADFGDDSSSEVQEVPISQDGQGATFTHTFSRVGDHIVTFKVVNGNVTNDFTTKVTVLDRYSIFLIAERGIQEKNGKIGVVWDKSLFQNQFPNDVFTFHKSEGPWGCAISIHVSRAGRQAFSPK